LRTPAKTRSSTEIAYVERINRAIDHVVNHLAEPLDLRAMARAACLSPFHFHRVFQALVGETPAAFVKRLRLERALSLMAHGPKQPLTNIALDCGFSSSSDFSRSFKHAYGAPPGRFDLEGWRLAHAENLDRSLNRAHTRNTVRALPADTEIEPFPVRVRTIPSRTVAYIRVRNPYSGSAVPNAAARLLRWAERHGCADGQWLGYQWENPELVALDKCQYCIAVETDRFIPSGEVGRFTFPAMSVAEVEIRGSVELELRALRWLYGSWLPRSGYIPDDHPGFEAFIGRPFAHGSEYFEFFIQLPVRRSRQKRSVSGRP
jgi:AraC family transcriptional regulator